MDAHWMEYFQVEKEVAYAQFMAKLIPTMETSRILGVRMPKLRTYARRMTRLEQEAYLARLPHTYYEELQLAAILLSTMSCREELKERLSAFLPYIDNWSTCDTLAPGLIRKEPASFEAMVLSFLDASEPYVCRLGISLLMKAYSAEAFLPSYLDRVAAIRREHDHVRMMQAWYFVMQLYWREEVTLPYLIGDQLEPRTRQKVFRKIRESHLFSPEDKARFQELR